MNTINHIIFFLLFTNLIFGQGPPITVETPIMLGLEGSGIRTFGKIISKENATIYVQPIVVPYNISTKFQVGGIFPIKVFNPNGADAVGGFGDLSVFAKYQLYKKDGTAKTFRILAHAKQTFPTGKTSATPPLGTDLYQTYIGLIVGRISSAIGFYSNFGYTITPETDNFIYNFSVSVPLLEQKYPQKQLNTFLELNGKYLIDPEVHTLFLSPGLQFIPGRRILFETSFQIPILQENISTNRTNYMLLIGTRFLIN
ncbi:MAG: hypothetical protein COB12_08610 [Flavobacterium sp.]|nr:MAG: hypothetical protein COB12_08610 [Flavobacterium sp.]